jgi:hypothetical protein
MSDFAQTIREKLEKATGKRLPWGDVNPLVVIGLTEAILDLGLNEEQMYPVVRSFLRQLAAQVHPDRNPKNVSVSRQQEILAALNYLDDRESFSRALDHFRTLKAEDRREIKLLSQTVNALRKQAAEVDKKEIAVRQEKEVVASEFASFRKLKQDEPLRVPRLEADIQELTKGLERSHRFGQEEQRLHRKWLHLYERIQQYMLNLGSNSWAGPPFHPFAFDAKWVVIAFLSYLKIKDEEKKDETEKEKGVRLEKQRERRQFIHSWTPFIEPGEFREEFVGAAQAAGISMEAMSEIGSAWNRAAERLQKDNEFSPNVRALTIAVIGLSAGYPTLHFGDRQAAIGRVIGSLSPHEGELQRKDLRSQNRVEIFENAIPFLIPGRILISAAKDRLKTSGKPLESLFESTAFYSRREILAAG